MSGIYIPGIRKPLSCLRCPCSGTDEDGGKEFWICEITHRVLTTTELCDNAPKDCPLVPVPDHGRLIDGDIAEIITYTNESGDFADGILCAAEWIAAQPTIIEAEESE